MSDMEERLDEQVVEGGGEDVVEDASAVGKLHQTFKCGSCGAQLEFKPGANVQQCPYCSHENPIPKSEGDIKELDFHQFLGKLSDQEEVEEQQTIKCLECAAEMTADPNVTAQACAFCGSPIVTSAGSRKQIKPRSLLPFKVTRREVNEKFQGWIKKLWFAPSDLKRIARQESKISGMYVPYWTYDSDTTSFYRGQRGEHYWVTQSYTTTVNGKSVRRTRRVRKTRWYSVSGTVWESFNDVLVLASRSLPRKYTEKLEPWDLGNLETYQDEYLSGFRAESYQVGLEEGFENARGIMDKQIRALIRRDIGGDEQRISSVNTQHDNITFKHVLLPIWISAYRYKKEVYRFLVNGRTGELQGERPWSWIKIALTVAAVLAAGAAAAFLIQQNMG